MNRYLNLNPYELHKHLINHYVLTKKGATAALSRDTSRDKKDFDIIKENHKFLWDDDEQPQTWEERLAKKYYDKLFKEYCICDLSRYKENKVAMRWQTSQELVFGKGQFTCGAKGCSSKEGLRTWEVNFGYIENNVKKNALVKLRLCPQCSTKLNYKHKRKEVKRLRAGGRKWSETAEKKKESEPAGGGSAQGEGATQPERNEEDGLTEEEAEIWKRPVEDTDEVSRDQEFEKYLEHLLL